MRRRPVGARRAARAGPRVLATALAALLGAAGCTAPPPPPARADATGPGRVAIRVPEGQCVTGTVELQVYDRARGAWAPHPERPRASTGVCLEERSDRLLTDLRIRCVDPTGVRPPSDWVSGTELRGGDGASRCPGPRSEE